MKRIVMIICISLLLFPLSSCSKSSVPTSTVPPGTFPTGTFEAISGFYRFIFNEDGSWTLRELTSVMKGIYSVDGNEFTFETDSYCDGESAVKGTYTWTFENNTLFFTVKEDKCQIRVGSMRLPYHKRQ